MGRRSRALPRFDIRYQANLIVAVQVACRQFGWHVRHVRCMLALIVEATGRARAAHHLGFVHADDLWFARVQDRCRSGCHHLVGSRRVGSARVGYSG